MTVDNYAIREVAERIMYAYIQKKLDINESFIYIKNNRINEIYNLAEQFVKYGAEHYPLNEELEDEGSD